MTLDAEVKKFLGVPPYDDSGNIYKGDPIFYQSLCSIYGGKQVQKAIKIMMNREILFRGKGNPKYNDGNWYYGYLLFDGEDYQIIEPRYGSCRMTVLKETVGEFTGMTDKNGKKIFEGDVVRYNGENHIVVFETRGGTGYFGIKIDHIETWGFCLYVPAKLMEVIGNIHDNPELAEGLL